MNAHIINCYEKHFQNTYRPNGYLGVGMVITRRIDQQLTNHQLLHACHTAYDMYADMKTVFPGDMIFVHAGEFIYGVFKAESVFKEDPNNVNPIFLSPNVHCNPNPNNPNSGWINLVDQPLPEPAPRHDFRQLSISHFIDENGNNLCFNNGFLANEVFELKRRGKLWSIPERWKYSDKARTVRPIMPTEAKELIKLLERENNNDNRLEITPKNIDNFCDIRLILDSNIVEDEKIIEAWICENLKTSQLEQIFGNITSFGNNVQIGYLQGIDIFGYVEGSQGICKYKVIEIKKDALNFNKDIQNPKGYIKRTFEYMDWVIRHLAHGDPKCVEGYIVAKSFDQSCIDFVKSYNKVSLGRYLSLVEFNYSSPVYDTLNLNKII